jgi:diacylglycerol kinase (ATP)
MADLFCLVVNPAAAGGRALRLLPEVTAALDAAGTAYQVTTSSSLSQAREVAASAGQLGHNVVAVGGDGLVSALAGVIAATGTVPGTAETVERCLGIIPAGRGNDLARMLGIPRDPARAAHVLAVGQSRLVDLLSVAAPGHPEMIATGSVYLGIPAVAGELANQMRWLRGPAAYRVAALRALAGWTPSQFLAEVTRRTGPASVRFTGYAIVVANSAYFGGGMRIAPTAEIDDGELDMVTLRDAPKLTFLRALAKVRNGSHVALPQVGLDRGTEVTITADRDMPAGADGEALPGAIPLRAGTPLRIRVLPKAMRVLAPTIRAARPQSME